MAARPIVSVFSLSGEKLDTTIPLPAVFKAPVRPDVVQFVYKNMAKNSRQPYAVSRHAGEQTSAESWGTGRAVSRIPRVAGGGTSRSGQAAFGNQCRGGRMFAPNKVWRRWHVKTNQKQKRYATASAVAATAMTSLVMARGHRIEKIQEIPLVVSDEVQSINKTKEAIALLKALNAYEDVLKVSSSRKLRAGKGKYRNRRHRQRRGPLIVYGEDNGLVRAFRNVPGIELVQVTRLNLLQLAPGAHLGRFVIWTQSAFGALDKVFGTETTPSVLKKDFVLPKAVLSNSDVTRIINSDEVQSACRPAGPRRTARPHHQKKNPLRNSAVLVRLNPYASVVRRAEILGRTKKSPSTFKASKAAKAKHHTNEKFMNILKSD